MAIQPNKQSTFDIYQTLFFLEQLGDEEGDLNEKLNCVITALPFIDPRTTPCGHTFDFGVEVIRQGIDSSGCFFKCDAKKPCRSKQMTENLFVKSLINLKSPSIKTVFLTTDKSFDDKSGDTSSINAYFESEVEEEGLDNRKDVKINVFDIMKCPLSRQKMEMPVLNLCGHTFDEASIKKDSKCPHDHKDIAQNKLIDIAQNKPITNFLAKEIIDLSDTKCYSPALQTFTSAVENKPGVILFLRPDTTLGKIAEIATSLGMPLDSLNPRFCVGAWNSSSADVGTPLSKIEALDTKATTIPILQVLGREIPVAKAVREEAPRPIPQIFAAPQVEEPGESMAPSTFYAEVNIDVGFGNSLLCFSSADNWQSPSEMVCISATKWSLEIPYSSFKFAKRDKAGKITWEADIQKDEKNRFWEIYSARIGYSFKDYMAAHPIKFPK